MSQNYPSESWKFIKPVIKFGDRHTLASVSQQQNGSKCTVYTDP